MDADYLYKFAASVQPKRIEANQVKVFLSKFNKGKYGELSLAEAWEARVTEHVKYWRDRYGLDDVKPQSMVYGSQVLKANWHTNADGTISATICIEHQPVLNATYMSLQSLAKSLSKLGIANGTGLYSLENLAESGELVMHGESFNSHDWYEWRRQIATSTNLPQAKIAKLINSFRFDENCEFASLQELEEHMHSLV